MRTLLLITVLATFASVTSSAEAQWLRSRRSSGCADGQCGMNSVAPAADQEASDSQPAVDEAPSSPAAPEAPAAAPAPEAPAAAPAQEAPAAAAAPAAPQAEPAQSASASSSRTRSANDAGTGRFWRRLRSRL